MNITFERSSLQLVVEPRRAPPTWVEARPQVTMLSVPGPGAVALLHCLREELSLERDLRARLEREVRDLRERLHAATSAGDPVLVREPPAQDPWGAWTASHQDELRRHAGRRIALDWRHGILASGTLDEVLAELERLGRLSDEYVSIDVVPAL